MRSTSCVDGHTRSQAPAGARGARRRVPNGRARRVDRQCRAPNDPEEPWFLVLGSYFANLVPGFLLTGIGLGFSFVPVSIAALSGVTSREAGLASGLITTSQQIGGGLGLAILSTVSTTRTKNLLAKGVAAPAALTDGYRLAFWVGISLAAVALASTSISLRRRDLRPETISAVSGADELDERRAA